MRRKKLSAKPLQGASDDLWPLSRVTGRVRGRIEGFKAVAMATFTLLWGGCSTIPLAIADPLAVVHQLILKTTSRRQSREQRGPGVPLQENIFLITHMIVERVSDRCTWLVFHIQGKFSEGQACRQSRDRLFFEEPARPLVLFLGKLFKCHTEGGSSI